MKLKQYLIESNQKINVYRVGRKKTLDNKNAGNIEGIISFLDRQNERGIQTGDIIQHYQVEIGSTTGEYIQYQGQKAVGKKSDKVGIKSDKNPKWPVKWYSFPKNGNWKIIKVGRSIKINDLDKKAKKLGHWSFGSMGWIDQKNMLLKEFK